MELNRAFTYIKEQTDENQSNQDAHRPHRFRKVARFVDSFHAIIVHYKDTKDIVIQEEDIDYSVLM